MTVNVKAAVRLELLVIALWSIAALVILICVYEYSHIVFFMYQIIDSVLQIHKCLLVRINIAYARRLVFILYVVLLLPYGGVTGICLVTNAIYCNVCESLATIPAVSDLTPPSASGRITLCVDYTMCPSAQSSGCGAPWFVSPLKFRFRCSKFHSCIPKSFS
jgi:hypothetical protein